MDKVFIDKILGVASKVYTPLSLAGLIIGAMFLIFRQILSMNIFPQLTEQAGGAVIIKIINVFLIISLTSIVLGFVAYVVTTYSKNKYPPLDPDFVSVGTAQDKTLEEIVRAVAMERNVTINFNGNCHKSIRNAVIEPGEHEGKNMKEFLENLRQRVKGQSIKYSVIKEAERRYEINCG
jgi:hypothetical protein